MGFQSRDLSKGASRGGLWWACSDTSTSCCGRQSKVQRGKYNQSDMLWNQGNPITFVLMAGTSGVLHPLHTNTGPVDRYTPCVSSPFSQYWELNSPNQSISLFFKTKVSKVGTFAPLSKILHSPFVTVHSPFWSSNDTWKYNCIYFLQNSLESIKTCFVRAAESEVDISARSPSTDNRSEKAIYAYSNSSK